MDVLVAVCFADEGRIREALLQDLAQPALDRLRVLRRENACAREAGRPRAASPDVVLEQPSIDTEGRAPREELGVGIARETARPEVRHQLTTASEVGGWGLEVGGSGLAKTERRPTTRQSPLNSLSRTAPVTRGWMVFTNASMASRVGENQRPLYARSAYARPRSCARRSSSRGMTSFSSSPWAV